METRNDKSRLTVISQDLEAMNSKLSNLASKENIDELKALIINQNEEIKELRDKIAKQDDQISQMNDKIAVLGSSITTLKNQQDHQEQYLRFNGIEKEDNETPEKCVKKVIEVCEDLQLDIKKEDIDRAHRIGKDKKYMIVKLHSFMKRTSIYKSRKKDGRVRIYLDLTKRRLDLLDRCRDLITDESNVSFVFADINCNTVAKLKNNTFKFFNSIDDFQQILDDTY